MFATRSGVLCLLGKKRCTRPKDEARRPLEGNSNRAGERWRPLAPEQQQW